MCGLFGAISNYLSPAEIDIVKDLGTVSVLRGTDGAGVVCVPEKRNKDPKIVRSTYTADDILYSREFAEAVTPRPCLIMGHTRSATTGTLELADSHPHIHGNIIGTHNGTLTSVCGQNVVKGKSDSDLLFKTLSELGPDKTFSNIQGSYAVVWIDTKDKTVNFLRNTERPLYIGCADEFNGTLYWASEKGFLDLVLTRSHDVKHTVRTFSVPVGTMLSFDLYPASSVTLREKRWMPPIVQETPDGTTTTYKPPLPPSVSVVHITNGHKIASSVADIIDLNHEYVTHQGKTLPLKELKTVLASGCAQCTQQVTMNEYCRKDIKWISRDEFLCYGCATKVDDTGPPNYSHLM